MSAATQDWVLPDFGGRQECLQVDPELFFPSTGGLEPQRARELQPLCDSCPVVSACLEYALANHVTGVWAGTSTSQRAQMRRNAGIHLNEQQRRAARNRDTVTKLTRKGYTSEQIVAHTGIHEHTVYRARRSIGAANGQQDVA